MRFQHASFDADSFDADSRAAGCLRDGPAAYDGDDLLLLRLSDRSWARLRCRERREAGHEP